MRLAAAWWVGALVLLSCRSDRAAPHRGEGGAGTSEAPADAALSGAGRDGSGEVTASSAVAPDAAPPAPPVPGSPFTAWLAPRLPRGGEIVFDGAGQVSVVHTVASGDTPVTIAAAYLDLTTVYRAKDLAAEIARAAPDLRPGAHIAIPHLLSAPYGTPEEERLRWPRDVALKGIFISGIFAGSFWPETLDKLAARKLNAVVLDAKDYMGTVNYPTQVKLATEIGAATEPPIPDYFRAIRFAHAKGIHVIARIPCFHDPFAAAHARRLSLMNKDGRPFSMGWIDPANAEAQDYIVDLVREAVALGADEVQLDYVRFPVQSKGIKYAAMPPADGHRTQVIRAFVKRVHAVTAEHKVPLSLDIFGVAATGDSSDIEALGQNIGVIGSEAEALSPMVYPSHYAAGWQGFAEPGNHPEIIGMGTRSALERLKEARIKGTIIRPWLQASSYKASHYGPQYVLEEMKSAETSGGVGWLLWDPANSYWALWQGLRPVP